MDVRMQCTRKNVYKSGGTPATGGETQTITERTFSSLLDVPNSKVQSASYSESIVGDKEDTSIQLDDIVVVSVVKVSK